MQRPRRMGAVVARWLLGTALVTWRYLWETTPLYRNECQGDERDSPPPVPSGAVDGRAQLASDGYGPLFHRRFQARIADAELDADQLVDRVVCDFKHFVPTEVVDIHADGVENRGLDVGDELVVEMPGPWNGPVRVTHRDATSLRLMTLRGHLEAGQVQFQARGDGEELVFEIELWARPSTRLVHMLYSRLRLAKEVQLNMWVRFCLSAVATSGGRLVDGVHIETRGCAPAMVVS
ncbi:DUF1990 family protein [Saccharomonospora cyanea]|uniref:DUF1990 domain-containing protein n=1 Tax=Saccharomonospora cyanea NA-134 TaxID=882082 RepID=H5XPV4_9PSEU|nr:DUF1990 family protein [Saccharomonospora cyanea]EHR61182.1 hypothetical protein SaccyDRAFT_2305 [Saccharomonospora cyanea NA-134]